MSEPKFIHLRVHTEFSLVDGIVRIKDMLRTVVERGMPAIAITDEVNLFGLIKFYKAAINHGIKPICGADLWLENAKNPDEKPYRLTLLVANSTGYRNLMELISRAYSEGQHLLHEKALLKVEWLTGKTSGLIALSGAASGEIGQAILNTKQDNAGEILQRWQQLFAGDFYLEIQRIGRISDETIIHESVKLAKKYNCPIVATNEVMFVDKESFEAHEVRVCINQGQTLDNNERPKYYTEQQYLRTEQEMLELFKDIPSALSNSVAIAKRCNLEIQLGTYHLPEYPTPDGMKVDEYFRLVSFQGLEQRLSTLLNTKDSNYDEKRQIYIERLEFELDIIIKMGFPGYFLIVMDFINWARNNEVPVGPGRGSGAGSLVAYAQRITDLDPLEYDLLFERFLNPERVSMPDFDIDFCMDNRDRVIDYVASKYGRDAVSQIATFGTMAAKAVVRDVARVQGKPFGLADRLSKLIPFEIGITLKKAMEGEPLLKEFVDSNSEAQEIMEMAYQLEGITRNIGKHAGGVVIAPTKLTDFSATCCDEEGNGLVTQFDKNDVEEAGLVKFDFLGLRTLTIIEWAVQTINSIRAERGEDPLNIEQIDLKDKATFELLQSAETTAVFQLESSGMKDMVRRLLPSRFEDIIALVALYRPGPLQSGMVDDFINRKHGRAEMAWPHPEYQLESLKPVLESTYGIILYQEQVMQIAQIMAGYTLGGADMLRRAMGKKKPEEMAKQRAIFLDGAKNNNIDENLAGNIFDLVEKFAGYGFNKSHSAAYALVAYQTAWLKSHYPAPFMAAVMSSDMQNTDKVVVFIDECRSMKIPLVLPDVNEGEYRFTVDSKNRIIYGLGAIKGVGEGPVDAITAARKQGGKFSNIFEFCKRVGTSKLNKRAMEALVRSGALDGLGAERAILWQAIPDALKFAQQEENNQNAGMADMFGSVEEQPGNEVYSDYRRVRIWTNKERLEGEKETLGLYLTGHPIEGYKPDLENFINKSIVDVQPARGKNQKIAGLVVDMRVKKSKKGDNFCFLTLDDRSARINVTIFSDVFEPAREYIQKDKVLIIEGEVIEDQFSGGIKLQAKKVQNMAQARAQYAQAIQINCTVEQLNDNKIKALQQLLQTNKTVDGLAIKLHYIRPDVEVDLLLAELWRVQATDELLIKLSDIFGEQGISLIYH